MSLPRLRPCPVCGGCGVVTRDGLHAVCWRCAGLGLVVPGQ
jgi:hypothetical protein